MNGLPVDYDNVLAFAKKHNLKVIADSAESLGCSSGVRSTPTGKSIKLFHAASEIG